VSLNPLPWILDSGTGFHLDRESLEPAFEAASSLGFRAVQADVPSGMTVAEYQEFLKPYGLGSGPGYFGADFHLADEHERIAEAAAAHARVQRELGLSEVFIAGNLVPERIASPAIGTGHSDERLKVVADGLHRASAAMRAEGLTPALHPHVASLIETEDEIEWVLDNVPADVLAFGPDTGHLAWARVDPAEMIGRHRDRVVAMHVKDIDPDAARGSSDRAAAYREATEGDHVFIEPGRGMIDFDEVFAALPDDFDGWCVLEVDVPNAGTALESTRVSAEWLKAQPIFAGALG
jgi:inosose dehydratase